jgi:hypothetical protein
MEYIMLIIGIALAFGLSWVLYSNYKNTSRYNVALTGIDTLIGISAGIFLIVTSLKSILF